MTLVLTILLFVRGALVLALALLACRLLRRAAASLRYVILASALAAVLVLPLLTALVPAWHTAALPALTTAPSAAEPAALPIAETAVPPVPATVPVRMAPAPAERAPLPWGAIAGAVWAAGVALLLARAAVGALRARRIAARGTPTPEVAPRVAEAWRAVGGRGAAPRVVTSAEIEAPIVVGALAPIVVVPRASAGWDAERWRVVLLHELAHVQRRDGLANLVAQIACSVHWPDPFAWLAARRLREERELAADDAVLRCGARASSYAEHLVAIASAASYAPPAAALAMAHPARFEARVVALLDGARSHRAIGARRTIAIAALVAGVAGAVACVSPDGAPSARAEAVAPPPSVAAAPGAPAAPPTATDPGLQSAAEAELDRVMTAFHASGAIAIVLEAKSGAIVALATRGDGDARRARAPGSTLKPFAFAAALDAGVVTANARIDCENGTRRYGAKTMTDASPHGVLDIGGALAVSSNVCTAKVVEPLGDRLGASFRRYHLAAPEHVDTHSLEGASLASGEGAAVSALDLATAYTAFADDGLYHAPGATSERVMTAETARAVRAMMVRVVEDVEGTGQAARIEGVHVAGKTGTAPSGAKRNYASFVGLVPADAPRFVVLVGADGVDAQGGKVAAPAFATIAARALAIKR